MLFRPIVALLLLVCAVHPAFSVPKAQDQVQVIRGPDIIVEEKPQIIVQNVPVVQNVVQNVVETSYVYQDEPLGCFRDNGVRDLPHLAHSGSNSVQLCANACRRLGFKFAGVQYSSECWCGQSYGRYGAADNCNMKCSSDSNQICGGTWANTVYRLGTEAPKAEGPLGYYGCFKDTGDRDLPRLAHVAPQSIESCKAACHNLGFKFAGVQYSSYCFCGNSFGRFGKADNCNMKCSGNVDQICGGGWANGVYAAGVVAADDGASAGLRGCFRDNGDRDLPNLAYAGSSSVQQCKAACQTRGFKYAGVQNGNECWCGNFYNRYGRADNCNVKCSGRFDQICGGAWANTVYRLDWTAPQPEGPHNHLGCFKDTGNRDLPHVAYAGSNSIEQCIASCKNLGFKYAGVQYTSWCFCGNFYGKYGKADNCNMKCNANTEQTCGGAWANNVFLTGAGEDAEPEGPLGHYGCYKDTGNRDLPHLAHAGSNSVELCKGACQRLGFKFAGVQYSSYCFCGNFFSKYGKADNCNMRCSANQGQICGGGWANNVYRSAP